MMKKLVFLGIVALSLTGMVSCGGPSDDQMKSLDSLNLQLDKALEELNTALDSTTLDMEVDTTVTE